LCSSTSPVDHAVNDLDYIGDAMAHPGPGDSLGHAFVDIDPTERVKSGESLAGIGYIFWTTAR
jgi:hypothetical protein